MSAMRDASMNTNMHAAFQREIDRLEAGLDSADLADGTARAGLSRRYQFFSQTLHHHHQGEDTYLFPGVRAKASPDEKAILDAMEAEHEGLVDTLTTLDEQFGHLDQATDKQAVAAQLEVLRQVLSAHGDHEERDGVPIVQKYISDEDFKAFMKFNRGAPNSSLIMPWMCDGADPAVQAATWGNIPAPVRLFLKPIMTRKYAAFTKECGV
jgi:iron-sulfur cluster repair protein YtfE (RIC family)